MPRYRSDREEGGFGLVPAVDTTNPGLAMQQLPVTFQNPRARNDAFQVPVMPAMGGMGMGMGGGQPQILGGQPQVPPNIMAQAGGEQPQGKMGVAEARRRLADHFGDGPFNLPWMEPLNLGGQGVNLADAMNRNMLGNFFGRPGMGVMRDRWGNQMAFPTQIPGAAQQTVNGMNSALREQAILNQQAAPRARISKAQANLLNSLAAAVPGLIGGLGGFSGFSGGVPNNTITAGPAGRRDIMGASRRMGRPMQRAPAIAGGVNVGDAADDIAQIAADAQGHEIGQNRIDFEREMIPANANLQLARDRAATAQDLALMQLGLGLFGMDLDEKRRRLGFLGNQVRGLGGLA